MKDENRPIIRDAHRYQIGNFTVSEKMIHPDIKLAHLLMSAPDEGQDMIEGSSLFNGFSISLTLNGQATLETDAFSITTQKNSTNVLDIHKLTSRVCFPCRCYESIGLLIKRDFMNQPMLEQLSLVSEKMPLLRNGWTNQITSFCMGDLLSSRYDGVLNDLFVHGKVLEILACEFSSVLSTGSMGAAPNLIQLSRQDINAIKKAKEILIQNISNPPSIPKLARMVALNQFKLKKGFHQVYNSTPYAIVRDHRMKMARQLLQSSEYNVGEVSAIVGIMNQAHFTRAFVKRYGVRPRDVMKTRTHIDMCGV